MKAQNRQIGEYDLKKKMFWDWSEDSWVSMGTHCSFRGPGFPEHICCSVTLVEGNLMFSLGLCGHT